MVLFQALTVAEASFRIKAMVMQDQEARFRMIGMKPNDPKREVVAELSRIDREDTAQMRQIVDQFGWPTISKFGAKTAGDAWLLVQHADLDHPFQRRCLALMKPLLTKKEVSGQNYAYLFDRVSVA